VKFIIVLIILLSTVTMAIAQTGGASVYGGSDGLCGNKTASGEKFNCEALTAAHKTLAFGTRVQVTYKGKSIVVRINDRGPFVGGRIIDLSPAAARALGIRGLGTVTLKVLP